MDQRTERRLDLVVYGATSFVGQLLCRRIVERFGANGDLRWAIAGRSRDKLDQVAAETGAEVERIVADAADPVALETMAELTKVVVSTVGPYALYGSPLIEAVVGAGTDYCDLTGEPQWMRSMIETHSTAAAASGSRIVHTCGFDSIPSDLGVWHLQQNAVDRFDAPCEHVSMRVLKMRGGASGGTVASMMNLMEEASRDKALRRILADPYALNPVDFRSGPAQPEVTRPVNDKDSGQWIAPFVMAAVNTRVVQRTHALLGRPWGPNFTYQEAMAMGAGPLGAAKAGALSASMAAGMGLAALGPTRRALSRFVLPKPGQGPSPEAQRNGSFRIGFYGRTSAGDIVKTRVSGDGDPGYSSTSRMLCEAATALVEVDSDAVPGGFWTPATAFGDLLIERLEAHARMRFEVIN